MSAPTSAERLTLTVDELAAMFGISRRLVLKLVKTQGHVAGVKPIPHIARRTVFPAAAVRRALGAEEDTA